MTLTEILLVILIISILYATFTLKKRIAQMDKLRTDMQNRFEEEQKIQQMQFEMPPVAVMRVPPPTKELNPKLLALEKQLDALNDTERHFVRNPEREKKEQEIIGKMVDIFMKEADKRVLSERLKPNRSGSK